MSIFRKTLQKIQMRCPSWLSGLVPQRLKSTIRQLALQAADQPPGVPYEPGFYPAGINLHGYFKAQMGLGQGVRLYADAVCTLRLPHVFLNTTIGNPSSHRDVSFDDQLSRRPLYNTNIIHLNAEQLPMLVSSSPAETWNKRYQIGVWLWELEVFPSAWNQSFRYVNEIWTPSHFSSQSISQNTELPVFTVPYGIRADIDPAIDRKALSLPAEDFLFLAMYDAHSMMSRKNPIGAIDAFIKAFRADKKGVGLVVKVNNVNHKDLAILHSYINGHPHIYLINKIMTKLEVNSLIACCDSFVSLHRSEGFGLVIAEAMLLGKPVIATNWSANAEFMNAENSCPVAYKLIDTGYDYYMSQPGQRWADPDMAHTVEYMRGLLTDSTLYQRIAKEARQTISTQYSIEKSGEIMKRRLKDIGVIP